MIARITHAYVRHYSDNGQTKAYVEWIDNKGKTGRTEGEYGPCACCGSPRVNNLGQHMNALFERAKREGVTIERETW